MNNSAFRCCYCGQMNAARNQRPQAPRLDMKHLETLEVSELLSELEKGIVNKNIFLFVIVTL